MIKALIVDDEASGRKVLEELIGLKHLEIELLPSVSNVENAIAHIDRGRPDLVFLDIKMGKRVGFEVLEKTIFKDYHVIFVTAYDEYALEAIKLAALDYLLKPVGIDELALAINRFKSRNQQKNQAEQLVKLTEALGNPSADDAGRVALLTKEGYELVSQSEIAYLVADHNYTEVFLASGERKFVSRNLGYFEEKLSAPQFMRIHKSHIVNLDLVNTYVPGNGGFVVMEDGRRFEVSRRKKKELLQCLNLEII